MGKVDFAKNLMLGIAAGIAMAITPALPFWADIHPSVRVGGLVFLTALVLDFFDIVNPK